MSSQPQERTGTVPSGRPVIDQTPESTSVELNRADKNRLYRLGYKNQDILELGVFRCRTIIDKKIPKNAKAALPGEDAARRSLTDERINERQGDAPRPTPGLELGRDELTGKMLAASDNRFVRGSEFAVGDQAYEGRVIEGEDYVSAAINLFANDPANRDYLFRVIDPSKPQEMPGPEWQVWKGADGKPFKVGDGVMAFMPKDVHREAYEIPLKRQSDLMTSAISNNPNDADLRMSPQDAADAPILTKILGPEGETHNAGALEPPAHPKGFVDYARPGA